MDGEKQFQAAIFDLDGTLLNTLDDIAGSMNRVLVRHGLTAHPVDKYRYFVGDGASVLVKRVVPPRYRQDQVFLAKCLKDFLADYADNWDKNARLYPGIAEMLDGLAAKGFLLGVLSNKPHDFTKLCVEKFLSKWNFQAVLGERPGIRRKPAPDGAFEIATHFGVIPDKCIYLGDTSIDMKTAIRAGMMPIGVLWGFRPGKELLDSGARLLIKQPTELLRFLQHKST